MSRSQHQSQGFGAEERRGAAREVLTLVAGEPAAKDIFEGIDLTWRRIPGGAAAGGLLAEAARRFDPERPEAIVPLLVKARAAVAALRHPDVADKLAELDEAIALACGLWLDANASAPHLAPGRPATVQLTAINRSRLPLTLTGMAVTGAPGIPAAPVAGTSLVYNRPVTHTLSWTLAGGIAYSQPYWLEQPKQPGLYRLSTRALLARPENTPAIQAHFQLLVEGTVIELTRPVIHRYVDRVRGELVRPIAFVPPAALEFPEPVLVFPNAEPKAVSVGVRANVAGLRLTVRLEANPGWRITPASAECDLTGEGGQKLLRFQVTPPAGAARGELRAAADAGGLRVAVGQQVVAYPHIPPQVVLPPAAARLVRADIRSLVRRVGYIMGAGDQVPDMLRQMGLEVSLLGAEDLARGDLARFDAIVAGVRAYNVRPDLRANQQRLLDYVAAGGAYVVQYNVRERSGGAALSRIGPYPLEFGSDRVSVEEAPVEFPRPDHPLLLRPNAISAADFSGWVQERGLYFASQWDPRYSPLFVSHDPGEKPLAGGTLYARHGKGAFVFTGYSWFRQLPAGVPGAFRIFANLLSAAKVEP